MDAGAVVARKSYDHEDVVRCCALTVRSFRHRPRPPECSAIEHGLAPTPLSASQYHIPFVSTRALSPLAPGSQGHRFAGVDGLQDLVFDLTQKSKVQYDVHGKSGLVGRVTLVIGKRFLGEEGIAAVRQVGKLL